MKRIIGIVLLLAISSFIVASPVVAQETETKNPEPKKNSSIMQVDQYVTLDDYEMKEDFTIEIEMSSTQSGRPVKLTDVFSGSEGTGATRMNTKSFRLAQGKNTITMQLTPFHGKATVSLATHGGTIAITEGTEKNLFTGEYSGEELVIFSVIGGFTMVTSLIMVAFRREEKIGNDFERVL